MDIASKGFWYSEAIPGIEEISDTKMTEIDSDWIGKQREEILEYLANETAEVWQEVDVIRGMERDKRKQKVWVSCVKLNGLSFCNDGTCRVEYHGHEVVGAFGKILSKNEDWWLAFLSLCKDVLGKKEGERVAYAWGQYVGTEYSCEDVSVKEKRSSARKCYIVTVGDETVCDVEEGIFVEGPWREMIWDVIRENVVASSNLSRGLEWTPEAEKVLKNAAIVERSGTANTRFKKYRDSGYGLVVNVTYSDPHGAYGWAHEKGVEIRYDKKLVFKCELVVVNANYSLYGGYEYWRLDECDFGAWLDVFLAIVAREKQNQRDENRECSEEVNSARMAVIALCKKYFCANKESLRESVMIDGIEKVLDFVSCGYYSYRKWDEEETGGEIVVYSDYMIRVSLDAHTRKIKVYSCCDERFPILVCDETGCFVEGQWFDHFLNVAAKKREKYRRKEMKRWAKRPSPEDYIHEISGS